MRWSAAATMLAKKHQGIVNWMIIPLAMTMATASRPCATLAAIWISFMMFSELSLIARFQVAPRAQAEQTHYLTDG
jgi:hypothetical protein